MAFSIFHLHSAHQDIENLKEGIDTSSIGYYYLGATIADAYVHDHEISNSPARDRFHYLVPFSTQPDDLFYAVKRFYQDNPWNFSDPIHKNYYLGYANHLLVDAVYSMILGRKYFGKNGLFPNSVLHHDIFRYLVDVDCENINGNQKIIDSILGVVPEKIESFIKTDITTIWTDSITKQIALMPQTDVFLEFRGDIQRFRNDYDHFNDVSAEIKNKINWSDVEKFKTLCKKIISIFHQQTYKPTSTITIAELEEQNL